MNYICGPINGKNMETAEERRRKVLDRLQEMDISYIIHEHPPLPTIEEAMKYWKDFDSTHCKNLFFRNHKGNRHYLVILECHKQMDIHGLEHQAERVTFHPNDNTASLEISRDDMYRFIQLWGGEWEEL